MDLSDYASMPYEQLKSLHRELGSLLAERRKDELEQLKAKLSELGFTPDDLAAKKVRRIVAKKYQDPDNPENTYSGKGPRPQWLKDALDAGRHLEEFAA